MLFRSASGYFATRIDARVDHELQRDLLLNVRAGWGQDDYRGTTRTDDYYTAGLGATYQLNRNFGISGGYTFRSRNSTVSGGGYTDNLLMLLLEARL